jgi:putative glutamine amidotransferase
MPHSIDLEYGERAIPQYERAVLLAGGEAVRIPLQQSAADIRKMSESCTAVLLPGSKADVDPAKFRQSKSPHTAAADSLREEADFLLLDHGFAKRKPVLCICYGLQSLNVYRGGSLVQHIPDFLPEETRAKVNHEAGRTVAVAHQVEIDENSRIASLVNAEGRGLRSEVQGRITVPVNSSHHQSADAIGDGLRIVARCPDDGIVEALEGTSPDHFVLAVQWHPERSVDQDEPSRAIFRALIEAANPK